MEKKKIANKRSRIFVEIKVDDGGGYALGYKYILIKTHIDIPHIAEEHEALHMVLDEAIKRFCLQTGKQNLL